jgi:hypothetical protein
MFTTWRLKKAACRMRNVYKKEIKKFTIGEGMYTGRGLKLFTEKVRWTFADSTWAMFTA